MPSIRLTVLLLPLLLFFNCQQPVAPAAPLPGHYETRRNHDPNGIGKIYLGREIAQVMLSAPTGSSARSGSKRNVPMRSSPVWLSAK
jgi:hypothetical protein